jgi:hypothetical protein
VIRGKFDLLSVRRPMRVVGWEEEEVVVRGAKEFFALGAGGPADGIDALDTERLNEGNQ